MPTPEITWIKDDKIKLDDFKSFDGSSVLHFKANNASIEGQYSCLARNSIGVNIASARVSFTNDKNKNITKNPLLLSTTIERESKETGLQQSTIFSCYLDVNNTFKPEQRRVIWTIDGERVLSNTDEAINLMNNGSLVLSYKAMVCYFI